MEDKKSENCNRTTSDSSSGTSFGHVPTRQTSSVQSMSVFERYKAGKLSDSNTIEPKPSTSTMSLAEKVLSTNSFPNKMLSKSLAPAKEAVKPKDDSDMFCEPKPSSSSASNLVEDPVTEKTEMDNVVGDAVPNTCEEDGKQKGSGPKLNAIAVNPRQKGNPVLKNIRNVPWEYDDIVPDYVLGRSSCALFLSLRYHHLHPNYIHMRLKELGSMYELRVILVLVDSKDPQHSLKELAKICLLANCTLILAWSNEEAGRYLETYKSYENKPPESIMERAEKNYNAQIADCLTSIKSVNKTDAMTLLSTFGSFEKISKASMDDLSLCPGFGPQKKQRLYDIFRSPFKKEIRTTTGKSDTNITSDNDHSSPPKKSKNASSMNPS